MTKDGELVILHDAYIELTTDIQDHVDRFGHKELYHHYFVPTFTLAELRTIYLKQRYPIRYTKNDKKYVLQTFQEVVDLIRALNSDFPRTVNAERKIGLYIEIKDWKWNKQFAGYNTADLLYDKLVLNGLETI